jgi:hypothetical protein
VEDPPTGVYEQLITCDLVRRIGDLHCAIVKWYGLRVLEKQLHGLKDRGGTCTSACLAA